MLLELSKPPVYGTAPAARRSVTGALRGGPGHPGQLVREPQVSSDTIGWSADFVAAWTNPAIAARNSTSASAKQT